MTRLLEVCLVVMILCAATPALACWDGYRFHGEKVAAMMYEPESMREDVAETTTPTYDAEHMRHTFTLLSALEANLPEGMVFEMVQYGPGEDALSGADLMLHCDATSSLDCEGTNARFAAWRASHEKGSSLSWQQVYVGVLEAAGKEAASLADHRPASYTIQIASSTDEKALRHHAFDGEDALVHKLPSLSDVYHGGFPSNHLEVFHVRSAEVAGKQVYRLLVGEFFSREHAQTALATLEAQGVEGFVRPASQTFYPK